MAASERASYAYRMEGGTVFAQRTRLRRKLLVLNDDFSIVQCEPISPLEERLFGFKPGAARLPPGLESLVRDVTAQWGSEAGQCAESRQMVTPAVAIRVFALAEDSAVRIAVLFEDFRGRHDDAR